MHTNKAVINLIEEFQFLESFMRTLPVMCCMAEGVMDDCHCGPVCQLSPHKRQHTSVGGGLIERARQLSASPVQEIKIDFC